MSNTEEPTTTGLEDVWYLKEILWSIEPHVPKKHVKIITQNFNGPCSFIAICNILILRDQIHLEPAGRVSVSYEYLSNIVAEYLLSSPSESDPASALSILPVTRKGMDLNPQFTAISSFRPAGDGGELKLFELSGIDLVHGWLVDPDSAEYDLISRVGDYDASVNLVVSADDLTKGQIVRARDDLDSLPADLNREWTTEERQKVEDAIVIRDFLERTSSQLTYHGLFHLASTGLDSGALVALFRGSHLSVLYKSADPDKPGLYTLVTDQVFAHEPAVVWERLEDVEGGASTFVDSDFVKSSPVGGDFAGRTADAVHRDYEVDEHDADQFLARQLQHEEDARAHEIQVEMQRRAEERQRQEVAAPEVDTSQNYGSLGNLETPREKKKKDCIVM